MSFSDGFLMGSALGMNATFGSLTCPGLGYGMGNMTPFDTCFVNLDSRTGFSSFANPAFASPLFLNTSLGSMPMVPSIFSYGNPFASSVGLGMGSFGSMLGFGGFNALF